MSARSLTPGSIADLTGAVVPEGLSRDAVRVVRVRAVSNADGEALVFAEDETSLQAALGSAAGLILAGWKLPLVDDVRVLRVAAPRMAFALCARELSPEKEASTEGCIHASAAVDQTARLGARVRVGPGAVVEAWAVIGDDCVIGSNVVVAEGVVLGKRVVVQPGAVLGSRGFGYVRDAQTGEYLLFPQQGALVIEDDVEIGANTTIDRGALEETRIGRGTKIDNLVQIGHNCRIGKNVVIAAQVGLSGSCVVEDGAVLAGQVGLGDHCHLGPGVVLVGRAGVYSGKRLMGAGEVFAGTPAEPVREHLKSLARVRRLR